MLRASNSKRRNLSSNASISVSSVISSGRGGRCIPVNKSSVDLLNGAGPIGSFGRAAKPRTPKSEMNGWRRSESFNTTTPFQAHENPFGLDYLTVARCVGCRSHPPKARASASAPSPSRQPSRSRGSQAGRLKVHCLDGARANPPGLTSTEQKCIHTFR